VVIPVKRFASSILGCLVLATACLADSSVPDLATRIEREVRSYYSVPPQVKITLSPRRASEFSNYDALTITFQGEKKQEFDFLISKDEKTLIRLTKLDLSKDPYVEIMKRLDIKDRPLRGNKDAKVVVVNFDDFECPYCSRAHQTLFPELLKQYGDRVAFVYKDYPLSDVHPWAMHAAVDANCLAAQNNAAYWDFADFIHANQSAVNSQTSRDAQFAELDRSASAQAEKHALDLAKFGACVKAQNEDAIKASMKEGDAVGVSATPTFFINGQETDGALSASEFRTLLDNALAQAGVPSPSRSASSGDPAAKAPAK
jgi:protein-disulfide isomerase